MNKNVFSVFCLAVGLAACTAPSDSFLGAREGYVDGKAFAYEFRHCRLYLYRRSDEIQFKIVGGFSQEYIDSYFSAKKEGCDRQIKILKWREAQAAALRSGLISRLATEARTIRKEE